MAQVLDAEIIPPDAAKRRSRKFGATPLAQNKPAKPWWRWPLALIGAPFRFVHHAFGFLGEGIALYLMYKGVMGLGSEWREILSVIGGHLSHALSGQATTEGLIAYVGIVLALAVSIYKTRVLLHKINTWWQRTQWKKNGPPSFDDVA